MKLATKLLKHSVFLWLSPYSQTYEWGDNNHRYRSHHCRDTAIFLYSFLNFNSENSIKIYWFLTKLRTKTSWLLSYEPQCSIMIICPHQSDIMHIDTSSHSEGQLKMLLTPSKWRTELEGSFSHWIYFHLRSKIFFWPSWRDDPLWICHWWPDHSCLRDWQYTRNQFSLSMSKKTQ